MVIIIIMLVDGGMAAVHIYILIISTRIYTQYILMASGIPYLS